MSILSQICEQASATIPFDKAQPIRRYDKDYVAQQQALAEQQLKEELAREVEDTKIEGFRSKKKQVEEKPATKKSKHKRPSFMGENKNSKVEPTQVKKINNLLSKICSGFDTKDGVDEEFIPKKKKHKVD